MKFFICLFLIFICPLAASSSLITPYEKNREQQNPCEIAICCLFQNEALWLKEWIEFHRLIGVEHFYLYNNLSTDNYLEILTPYIDAGIVELFNFPIFPLKNWDQPTAYNHALDLARGKNEWLAIIDTDEFITPMTCDDLKDFLRAHKQFAGIYAKWQLFGTSNIRTLNPGELMIEKLRYKCPPHHEENKWGKSIVQPLLTKTSDSPHFCSYIEGGHCWFPPIEAIVINHYFVRTEDFLYNVKLARLRQWAMHAFYNPNKLLNFLPTLNSTKDDSMQRYVAPLKQILFEE